MCISVNGFICITINVSSKTTKTTKRKITREKELSNLKLIHKFNLHYKCAYRVELSMKCLFLIYDLYHFFCVNYLS